MDPEHDAIVVGTGFGCAVTACRLAQAGLDVLVLERGRRFEAGDFPDLPVQGAWFPDLERWSWQSHRGLWDVQDLGPLVSAQAAGYGGGSLIYANVQLRPPSDVFDSWPEGYDEAQLREHYDLAGWMLDIAPIDRSPELSRSAKTQGFDVAAAKLKRSAETFHPPLALRYAAGDNAFGRQLAACNGCGRCCLGCPHEAKSSLDHNYLYVAEQYPNVHVKTRSEALAVHAVGAGYGVEYRDELCGGSTIEASARFVFLCAGALGTTKLLARSAERHARDRRRGLTCSTAQLGKGYFANGDAVSLVFDTAERHQPTRGPTITTSTIHHDAQGFVLVQDGGYPLEMSRAAGAFAAPAWLAKNRFRAPEQGAVNPRLPLRAAAPEPGASPLDSALVSPLDTFEQALRSGALDAAIPAQLREAVATIRQALMRETRGEFEELVNGMIERSLQALLARAFGQRLRPGSRLHDQALKVLRNVTLRYLTDREELATFAQRAFFERFGLFEPSAALPRALSRALGGEREHTERGAVLLAMGQDTAEGELVYGVERDELGARVPGARSFDVLSTGERLQRDMAEAMGGELRTSPIASLLGKPMTVHSQGGCRMSASAGDGVTTLEGEVHGHPGLFVMDAATFPASVGVNPSATVLAVAERNVLRFLQKLKANPAWPSNDRSPGARQFDEQRARARAWARDVASEFALAPPRAASPRIESQPVGLTFGEVVSGFLAPNAGRPQHEADYYDLETRGRSSGQCVLKLRVAIGDLDRFWRDPERRAKVDGTVSALWPDSVRRDAAIDGELQLLVEGTLVPELPGGPNDLYLLYSMQLRAESGERATLSMYKRMPRAMNRFAWRGASRFYSRLEMSGHDVVCSGILRADLSRFMFQSLPSMQVTGTSDPARIAWALGGIAKYFAGGFSPSSVA